MIAGASEGLGAAFADALASVGFDLILIARREHSLTSFADEIRQKYSVEVSSVICDLSTSDAAGQIVDTIGSKCVDFLIYNAASSYIGDFLNMQALKQKEIMQVNMLTLLTLVHSFGSKMAERRRGGVLLMTSIAGFQGAGYLAAYAATKAFIHTLAEGLWYEWKNSGVDITACCAGAISTPNFIRTNPGKSSILEPPPQQPEKVVAECLRRIGTTPSFVCGRGNK